MIQTEHADRREVAAQVNALCGIDCAADLALAQKTRRAVREAVNGMEERRIQLRRNLGIAGLILFSILVLMAPAIWNGVEDFLGGEYLAGLPVLLSGLFLGVLFPAVLAALIAAGHGSREAHRGRRNF